MHFSALFNCPVSSVRLFGAAASPLRVPHIEPYAPMMSAIIGGLIAVNTSNDPGAMIDDDDAVTKVEYAAQRHNKNAITIRIMRTYISTLVPCVVVGTHVPNIYARCVDDEGAADLLASFVRASAMTGEFYRVSYAAVPIRTHMQPSAETGKLRLI